jgi:WD repeat-containing protein 35
VELYRQAEHHADAARLLTRLAREAAAARAPPLRIKKLHVLAALEADKFKRKSLEAAGMGPGAAAAAATRLGTQQQQQPAPTMQANAAQTLAGANAAFACVFI